MRTFPGIVLRPFLLLLFAGLATMGGCKSVPTADESLPPSLQLLQSAPLVLAEDCRPMGTVIVQFTVLPSGHTSGIQTAAAEPCVRQALTAWVGSFRYSPPATEMPESIEWMLVTAQKGS